MKTIDNIKKIIHDRKINLLENLKETQKNYGTNNCGYSYELGAYNELQNLLEKIEDENN